MIQRTATCTIRKFPRSDFSIKIVFLVTAKTDTTKTNNFPKSF
jgi:hypothetical protein